MTKFKEINILDHDGLIYIEGDITKPMEYLELFLSKGEIRRKQKEGAIKLGRPHLNEVWIKVGKKYYIVISKLSEVALNAQIWWEYHNQLMPKTIKWEKI